MAYTEQDFITDAMNGDQPTENTTPAGAVALNRKRKSGLFAQYDPTLWRGPNPRQSDTSIAGAGADGTNNGGTSPNNVSNPTKPVIQNEPTATGTSVSQRNKAMVGPEQISPAPEVKPSGGPESIPTDPNSEALPQLAKQGSSNRFLRFFQRGLGEVGDTPQPGQPYNTPEEQVKHREGLREVFQGIGGVGAALRAGGGGAPQQAQAMQYLEEQPRLAMQQANIQNEMQHRLALEKQGEERVDVSRENAETGKGRLANSQNRTAQAGAMTDARLAMMGQKRQVDGSVRPMTADELTQNPAAQESEQGRQMTNQLKQAEMAQAQARTALMNDPNNPDRQLRARQIDAMVKVAQDRMASYMLARQVQATDTFDGGEKIVSMADVNANPGRYIPLPTGTTRTMQQMATSVQGQIPGLKAEVQNLAAELGPAVGRWNELWVNRAGMDDPKFSGLDQDLHLFASAVSRTHFGGGAPLEFTHALEQQFGQAQSPADLLARIDSAEGWIRGYAQMSGRKGLMWDGQPLESSGAGATPFQNPANPSRPPKPISNATGSKKPKITLQ